MQRKCPYCKEVFAPKRSNQSYCRQSCKQGAYMVRLGIYPEKNDGLFSVSDAKTATVTDSPKPSLSVNVNQKKPSTSVNEESESMGKSSESDDSDFDSFDKAYQENLKAMEEDHARKREEWEKYLKSVNTVTDIPPKNPGDDVFRYMFRNKLTVNMTANGFKKEVFPHWSVKDFRIAQHVNYKLLDLFEKLRRASHKGIIKRAELRKIMTDLKELSSGLTGILLPCDYPFARFVLFLREKLKACNKAGEKQEVKFKMSENWISYMTTITVQVDTAYRS